MTTPLIRTVTLDKLTPDPANVRKHFDKKSITTLAANLKARGVLTPLLVREEKKRLIIVDGERRYRAAKVAKLKAVPVVVLEAGDAVQRSLDQVAVNSLREPLKPLELGRLLVSLRKDHKLSDNDIAAHLDKQGIPALSKADMGSMMRLVELPKWAQDMIDDGRMGIGAAPPILGAQRDKAVASRLSRQLEEEARMGGVVTDRAVENTVRWITREQAAADLNATDSYYSKPVLFDSAKACKGCEHLRTFSGARYCMNREHFDQLQAEAKAAGLGPGGKKPTPQQKAAETRAASADTETRQERKLELYGEKLQHLVHGRLQEHLVTVHMNPYLASVLTKWLAARQPNGRRFGGQQWFSQGENGNAYRGRPVEDAVEASPLKDLPGFLSGTTGDLAALELALGKAAIRVMSWRQVQTLAHHAEVDIAAAFKVDADYLAIQSLDQLKELGRLAGIEGANRMTGKALKVAILASPDGNLGVPADVVRLYSEVPEPEPEEEHEDFDDEEELDADDLDEHQETLEEAGEAEAA